MPRFEIIKIRAEHFILRVGAVAGALAAIVQSVKDYVVVHGSLSPGFYMQILSGLNVLALMIYCLMSVRVSKINFSSEEGKAEYARQFNQLSSVVNSGNSIEMSEKNNERVNLLVRQLNRHIMYYAFMLMITYILFMIDRDERHHEKLKIAEDLTNFMSSIFLYLAFKVLYDKTLDEDLVSTNYYTDAIIFSGLYIISYIFFAVAKINVTNVQDAKIIENIFSLLAGVFNGLAMTLLFSRYISMEHSVSKIPNVRYSDVISIFTIVLLPIYTLAQPLFGNFDIQAFGSDPNVFKNCVFLVCLVGKVFFLYMTYYFIKRRLMHLYLHVVLTRHDSASRLASCFNFGTN